MSRFNLAAIAVLFSTICYGQGQTIIQSAVFTWTDTNALGVTANFKMYCQEDSSPVVLIPSNLRETIPAPTNIWANDLPAGHWFCAVTAVHASNLESGPSNELEVTVEPFTAPANFEILIPEEE